MAENTAELVWLAQMADRNRYTEPRHLGDGRYAAIMHLMFTAAIITGRIGDEQTYEDRWCYHSSDDACKALAVWDGKGEPDGWHRHPSTGRRRKSNEAEYINF